MKPLSPVLRLLGLRWSRVSMCDVVVFIAFQFRQVMNLSILVHTINAM